MDIQDTQEKATSVAKKDLRKEEYISTIGRRKTASARVRLFVIKGSKHEVIVNNKPMSEYFTVALADTVLAPFAISENITDTFKITAIVKGGGSNAQAEAVRHGISRALTGFQSGLRGELKKAGYIKRDPRKKERKKFGLRGARRAPQWSKR